MLRKFIQRFTPSFGLFDVRVFFRPVRPLGSKLTLRRLLNLYVVRFQRMRGHSKVHGYPVTLTIESANVCNLACPFCFTGAGEVGRAKTHFPMSLYKRTMDELGDYLFQLELHNWGEPLLNKNIPDLIQIATDKGVSTLISTNFSFPFSEERAEALVGSGLSILGVSLDGARQETYEQYRVKGNLEVALDNVRRINAAKKKLGSASPKLIWEFHVFEWNEDDIELARSMAEELDMEFAVDKGWVAGPEWNPESDFKFYQRILPSSRCEFLWERAVINSDGGVAACCGAFYKEDDFGSVQDLSFKEVWNNKNFQEARKLFASRDGSEHGKSLICHECPATLNWEDYKQHVTAGGERFAFTSRFNTNDGFNFFFNRRPAKQPDGDAVIGLQQVAATPAGPGDDAEADR